MFVENETALFDKAVEILKENDRGLYTVPTKGLYPFQWNWDSCLTALGQSYYDETRAWQEIRTLFAHQWPDGMVPHIVFHEADDGYFPGPDVWATGRATQTSGITQPPVAGFAVQKLLARAVDTEAARSWAQELVPAISNWHAWFYANRDPDQTGLVAILHPWESGRDNSADWDQALARVPVDDVMPYQRRDTQHANPAHRPTKDEYDRYIALVQQFRALGWDNTVLHEKSWFKVVEPGFNAILIRSCNALAEVAHELGMAEIAAANQQWAERGSRALESLWQTSSERYACFDRISGQLIDSASIGGLLPILVNTLPEKRQHSLAMHIAEQLDRYPHPLPSHDPEDSRFDATRYWRGPAWLIINYMIIDGLLSAAQGELAQRLIKSSLATISEHGFAEYYDPLVGTPCGGGRFTWTAAMVLEFLNLQKTLQTLKMQA